MTILQILARVGSIIRSLFHACTGTDFDKIAMDNKEDKKQEASMGKEKKDSGKPRSKPSRSSRASGSLPTSDNSSADDANVKRKPSGARPSRPGATRSNSEALDRLEADIASKKSGRRAGPATKASVERTTSSSGRVRTELSQFESDVRSKNRSRRAADAVAMPGTATAIASHSDDVPAAGVALTQLERDVVSKSQARPGARAATGGRRHGKRSGRASREKSQEATARSQPHSNLQTLEDDIMAKQRARQEITNGVEVANRKGTAARSVVDVTQRSNLQNLEDDVRSKNQARREHIQASTAVAVAAGVDVAVRASTEASVSARNSMPIADRPAAQASAQAFDALSPPRRDVVQQSGASTTARPANTRSVATPVPSPSLAPVPTLIDQYDVEEAPAQSPAAVPVPLVPTSSRPVSRESRPRNGSQQGGIEAFVADNVVDAANVAVVKSEEEEEEEERKRYKKYLCYGCLLMIVLAVAIVVPVAMFAGGDDSAPQSPTATPSTSPTSSPTLAPTSGRFDTFLSMLRPISGDEIFLDRSSPQYQAALWVTTNDPVEPELSLSSDRILQRYYLATLYFSTNGDDWLECGRRDPTCGGDPDDTSWLSANDECTWFGVQCENDTRKIVAILFLRNFGNHLNGTLPYELSLLKDLTTLFLQNNNLQGSIPTFLGALTNLSAMIFSGNQFQGTIPSVIFETTPLMGTIFLGSNDLSGEIPTILASLPNLSDLRLDDNSFDGQIPSELGSIKNLRILELQNNELTGDIPDELFGLSTVRRLQLNDNPFTGTLPTLVGQLQSLREFSVNGTLLGGELPEQLFTVPSLARLWLDDCSFSGTLSESFGFLSNLVGLWLDNNQFEGPIPAAFSTLTDLNTLVLHDNDLTGSISDELCARKGNTNAYLRNLTADCAGEPPEVFCPSRCCDICV